MEVWLEPVDLDSFYEERMERNMYAVRVEPDGMEILPYNRSRLELADVSKDEFYDAYDFDPNDVMLSTDPFVDARYGSRPAYVVCDESVEEDVEAALQEFSSLI